MSESLKKLVIDSFYREPEWDDLLELEIVAPKIESMEIRGSFYDMRTCQIKDMLALVKVKVDFEIDIDFEGEDEEEDLFKACENIVREHFESLHQVKKLVIGKWCLMVSFS